MFSFNMDAHMHFDLYPDRNAVLDYIEEKRSYTIAVTNLPAVYERYVCKYDKLKYTKIALGYHPELVVQYPNQMYKFEKLLDSTRYIGEIGLDYSIDDVSARQKQFTIFQEIVEKCTGKGKILSIHSRRAVPDVLRALAGFDGKVILHWYSGSIRDMAIALDRGYYFSINQQMITSKFGQNIISRLSADRILLESDAPFTKGLEKEYSLTFNDNVFGYLAQKWNTDIETAQKRVKANFAEVLK